VRLVSDFVEYGQWSQQLSKSAMSQDATRNGKLQFCKGRIKQKATHFSPQKLNRTGDSLLTVACVEVIYAGRRVL